MKRVMALGLVCAALVVGCSSSSSGGSQPTTAGALAEIGIAFCQRLQTCYADSGVFMLAFDGGLAQCEGEVETSDASAPNCDQATLNQCTQDIASVDCGALMQGIAAHDSSGYEPASCKKC